MAIDRARYLDEREVKQFIGYLEKRFSTREYRKQAKLLTRASDRSSGGRSVESLRRWSDSKKIDLSLFAVYRRIKKSYKSVR